MMTDDDNDDDDDGDHVKASHAKTFAVVLMSNVTSLRLLASLL